MTLIAIGGQEGKSGDMTVLKRVLDEARGKDSRVLVITTATGYPEEVGQTYRDAFANLGVSCDVEHTTTPTAANDPELLKKIAAADVVFFTGGDQNKLATVFNGSDALKAIGARHLAGGVIAGTSAGAAAMSSLMVCGGDPRHAMRKGEVEVGEGFGLTPDIVFDTHFMNRNRLKRLFAITAAAPAKTGIGLDEDTAVICRLDGEMEVIGAGAVTVVEAKGLTRNNVAKASPGDRIRAEGFHVKTLKSGDRFRLG
jgi:cyanophycinase